MEETGVLVNLDLLSHCYPTLNQAAFSHVLCHFTAIEDHPRVLRNGPFLRRFCPIVGARITPFAHGSERGPYSTPFSANDFASQSGHSRSVSVCRLKPRMNHRRRLRSRPHRTATDRPGSALKPAQLAQLHHKPQAARVRECDHGLRRLHDEPSGGFEGCTANRPFASKVARR
jgi:hypothetical protein